jgi:nitrite reductase (NADH) small subunit
MKHVLFPLDEIAPGEMRPVKIEDRDIVIARTPDGMVHALRDYCPHFGAKLSAGSLQPMVGGEHTGQYDIAEGRFVARCPWHGYEFDLETGYCPADKRVRIPTYLVTVESGKIAVEV